MSTSNADGLRRERTEGRLGQVPGILDRIQAIEELLRLDVIYESDRGAAVEVERRAVFIYRSGLTFYFRAATPVLAAGASARIYLTRNARAGGPPLFSELPRVRVLKDAVLNPVGITTVRGPIHPDRAFSLQWSTALDAAFELVYHPANRLYYVDVTNLPASTQAGAFVVFAEGP